MTILFNLKQMKNTVFQICLLAALAALPACDLERIDPVDPCAGSGPTAVFTADKTECTVPCTVSFTNTSTGATTWQWDFGNGEDASSQTPGAQEYTTAGNYKVRLIASNADGCRDTAEITLMMIDVQIPPVACFTQGVASNNGEAPSQISFSALCTTNATSFSWDFGDPQSGAANSAFGMDVSHQFDTAGTYQVQLTAIGPAGQDDTTIAIVVKPPAGNPPVADFTIFGGGCAAPCPVSFTNQSTDATSYEWDFGDGSPKESTPSPSHVYQSGGTFNVTLLATGPGGTDTKTLTVAVACGTFVKTFGGAGTEHGYAVQQTLDDGYILLGTTSSLGAGSSDMYLLKTDKCGNELWAKTFGGPYDDEGRSIQQTTDGGFILAGTQHQSMNDNPDVLVVKTDASGNVQWSNTYGSVDSSEYGHSVRQTSDGGYVIGGNQDNYMYLLKLKSNGAREWGFPFGPAYSSCRSVVQTANGNYALLGQGEDSDMHFQMFLLKVQINNVTKLPYEDWNKIYEGDIDSYSRGASLLQKSDGGFVLFGSARNTTDNTWDCFLVRTDASGAKQGDISYFNFFAAANEFGNSISPTTGDGYILLGTGNDGGWLIKTESSGNKTWDRSFGANGLSAGYSVQQTTDEGYILLGETADGQMCLIKTNSEGKVQ